MTNKENKDKLVKISADRHQQLKVLSAKERRDMKDIINEAFDDYMKKTEKRGVE